MITHVDTVPTKSQTHVVSGKNSIRLMALVNFDPKYIFVSDSIQTLSIGVLCHVEFKSEVGLKISFLLFEIWCGVGVGLKPKCKAMFEVICLPIY